KNPWRSGLYGPNRAVIGRDSSAARTPLGEAVTSAFASPGSARATSVRSLLDPGLLIAWLKLPTTGVAAVTSGRSLVTKDASCFVPGFETSTSLVRSAS